MENKRTNLTEDKYFEHAFRFVLSHEGGYSDDPDDAGGETKFGISKRSYPHIDINALTIEEAKNIYKRDFWDSQLYDAIKNINLATKIFDLAVNMGSYWAHRLVQRALKKTGQNITEDGILGPKTLEAINKSEFSDLLTTLKSKAAEYYRTLVENQPQRNKFLKGWLKRAYA